MYYSNDIIEEIRVGNDIIEIISSYIPLKQKGSSYFGLCPFHNESTPSFSVSEDKQLFHCFGCGASGNVFSFIMKIENYDFIESVKFLADRINYNLPESNFNKDRKDTTYKKNLIYDINKTAAKFFYKNLKVKEGNDATNYLNLRKINNNMRTKYGLGYALKCSDSLCKYLVSKGYEIDSILESGLIIKNKNGKYFDRFRNRIMFPIFNVQGKVVGFGGRILNSGEPKYLNSPENLIFIKSKNLYNINYAKEVKSREFIIVEGYMDVITLCQYGTLNVVGALGTSFNIEHAKLLKKYVDSVIIAFDNDEAGLNATLRAIPILLKSGLKIKVLKLKNAKDPDEYISNFGIERFNIEIKNCKSHINFQIDMMKNKYDITRIEEKIEFTAKIADILSNINSNIELDVYIKEVAKITEISELAIKSEIDKKKRVISSNIKNYIKPNYEYKVNKICKGLYEAKKSLINLIASDFNIYRCIKCYLSPKEMNEDIYEKLLTIIYKLHENKKDINIADIVSYFENIDDQKIVAEIFSVNTEHLEDKDISKILNDQIKLVKKNYIENQIAGTNDIKVLKKLIDDKRNIETLNISILGG